MTGFSYCWRPGPTCSANLRRQRKQKHKWIARWLNAAFVLFNMSHRQCPWCARAPPHVNGSQAKGMMDTAPRRRDDTQPYLTCFHMRAAVSGGGGQARQVFFFTFSPAATCFMQCSSTDLTLDKWRWQGRRTCSNITSASCASTTALLSLKAGANSLNQADESHSAWLKVCSFILMKSRANVTPFLSFFFPVSKFGFVGMEWSIHFHPQLCSCIKQWVTRLLRLSCTSRISTLVLLLKKWRAINVTGKSVCFYLMLRQIFIDNFRWQPRKNCLAVLGIMRYVAAAGAAHTH